jgi:pyruvate kinase
MRRAKIVCTLGPASREPGVIGDLIDEGMNVARINFSHGDRETHAATIRAVRAEADKRGVPVAILQDLQGPKIRVGRFTEGQVELEPGADFTITTRAVPGSVEVVSTTYEGLPRDVKPGDVLLLDDGLLSLEVERVDGEEVSTRVLIGGVLKNNKGINLPGVKVSAPALTDKDRADLAFGLELGVDFIALSFVRSPEDVREAVRLARLPGSERHVPIIAKIEKPEAVDRLEDIIDVADGVMVARGDLGVEIGAEKVPLVQKRAIGETNQRGKIVITATQMLESMVSNPRPTRAEASDVANAVLDGTDALMLSGETAAGRYPLLAVRTMARIIEEIESSSLYWERFDDTQLDMRDMVNAVAKSSVVAARQMGASVIACATESGGIARLMSDYRPHCPLVAFTSRPEVYRRLALYWGVLPRLAEPAPSFDDTLVRVNDSLLADGLCKRGDLVVLTMAVPFGLGLSANTLHLHRIT